MARLLTGLWADDQAAVVSPQPRPHRDVALSRDHPGTHHPSQRLQRLARRHRQCGFLAVQSGFSFPGLSLLGAPGPGHGPIAQVGGVQFASANGVFFVSKGGDGDPTFQFSYSDSSGNVANGTLTATDLGGGQYLATGGTLTVTGGADVGTYSLYPGGPGVTTSPSGAFIYDNVVTSGSNPFLDVDGLLFTGGGLEINIWGNSPNNYSFYSSNVSGYNVSCFAGSPSAVLGPPAGDPVDPVVNPARDTVIIAEMLAARKPGIRTWLDRHSGMPAAQPGVG